MPGPLSNIENVRTLDWLLKMITDLGERFEIMAKILAMNSKKHYQAA
ncbi:hypothetical protein [Companilactobacillus keshanensis]|nr:hypothetical protein [Companilactobacillus keshanensis]